MLRYETSFFLAYLRQAGLETARARGRMGGRPKALDAIDREIAVKLYKEKNLVL